MHVIRLQSLQSLADLLLFRFALYGARVTKVNNNTAGWPWSNNMPCPPLCNPSFCGAVSRVSVSVWWQQGRGELCAMVWGLWVRMRWEKESLTGALPFL